MKKPPLLSIACLGLASMSANADTLETELAKCGQVKDSLARLVCFDDLVKTASLPTVSKKQSVVTVPRTKTVPVTAPIVSKEESFGAEHLKKNNDTEDVQQVTLVVESLDKNHYGQWRFTFKNGQQWKQTDSGYFKLQAGESVILKKGALGAFYLKKNDIKSNRKIRVKRVK